LPDLSERSEIEVGLALEAGVSLWRCELVSFVRISQGAIAAARNSLKAGVQVVCDVNSVLGAIDQTRLAHLNCRVTTLISDPHITSAVEAETSFWKHQQRHEQWQQFDTGCILVIGYAPSVLLSAIAAIEKGQLQPSLVIGMPIGFSHAPAAKRRLMQSCVPFITVEGTLGGGLLAAVALNALAESLIEKPNCHCHLG
jgi:precorrin-8X/cobalt-precorrin-8 methylmutase